MIVEADNTLLGEKMQVKADLVVLGTGMVPATTVDDPVVNMAYRQGPAFRDIDLFDRYVDSNFICFPYETQRTGIYAAGAIRRSMTMEEAMDDAAGAALKAIQCMESANRGVAVHPRSGDMTFPDFFFQRCTQCKRCTEECPFGAIDDDEKGTPETESDPLPPLRHLHGGLSGADHQLCRLQHRQHRLHGKGGRRAVRRRLRGTAASDPGAGVRKRRLSGAGHRGLEPAQLLGGCALHSGALPRLGQRDLDQGCAFQGNGRSVPAGLQTRRRLPVPYCQRKRTWPASG